MYGFAQAATSWSTHYGLVACLPDKRACRPLFFTQYGALALPTYIRIYVYMDDERSCSAAPAVNTRFVGLWAIVKIFQFRPTRPRAESLPGDEHRNRAALLPLPRGAHPSYVPVRSAVRIPLHTLPRSE